MYVGIALCGFLLYRGINNKPMIPGLANRKTKKVVDTRQGSGTKKEIKGPFNDLIGIKQFHGNLFELRSDNKTLRTFVGAIRCEPINYGLRSYEEQKETDNAYEHLLASLSLGPGREVKVATHIHSRPIELVDQMKLYHENFPKLDPIAQRYAQSMFFPFMEMWQRSVEDHDYSRYFLVILEYSDKMIGEMDEESILIKVRNEYGRLASNIISNYGRMGGYAEECRQLDLYEALYFATHKKTASIQKFRKIFEQDQALSQFVVSDYSRDAYRYLEDEEQEHHEIKDAV